MGEGGRLDAPLPPSATLAAPRVGPVVGPAPGRDHDCVLLAGLLA
jgi:hypothetical protein